MRNSFFQTYIIGTDIFVFSLTWRVRIYTFWCNLNFIKTIIFLLRFRYDTFNICLKQKQKWFIWSNFTKYPNDFGTYFNNPNRPHPFLTISSEFSHCLDIPFNSLITKIVDIYVVWWRSDVYLTGNVWSGERWGWSERWSGKFNQLERGAMGVVWEWSERWSDRSNHLERGALTKKGPERWSADTPGPPPILGIGEKGENSENVPEKTKNWLK